MSCEAFPNIPPPLLFFKTGFLCVTALAILQLDIQVGLRLTEILLPLPPEC